MGGGSEIGRETSIGGRVGGRIVGVSESSSERLRMSFGSVKIKNARLIIATSWSKN